MHVNLLTREFPPEVYGGAGVHVDFLARGLRPLVDLEVHCFGAHRDAPGVVAHPVPDGDPAIAALEVGLAMARAAASAELVHSHTWYANFGGHLAKLRHGIPHVVTAHSLEPLRPWKEEQLGGGYAVSGFAEDVALTSADHVVAVSGAMRDDLLRLWPELDPKRVSVVHNGIDTEVYRPDHRPNRLGVRAGPPTVVCVGRLTRQKGLDRMLRAAPRLLPGTRLVMCAGEPDTPAIDREFRTLAAEVRASGCDLLWIREQLDVPTLCRLLTLADVFVCPSVYEPLGLVNLEAMACGTAVVGTDTGGIPEVVVDGLTGLLVPPDPDPEVFAVDLAEAVNGLLADRALAASMGAAGRARAQCAFSWESACLQVRDIYRTLLNQTQVTK
ncbi:starch synthase [Streptacidiphilus sp. MAP12-20]|uniref:glycogen synthase n=1 Tax=Streptacidiphilus sp. MAP12-20 TaxID=3156299 RepID=UPI003514A85D